MLVMIVYIRPIRLDSNIAITNSNLSRPTKDHVKVRNLKRKPSYFLIYRL